MGVLTSDVVKSSAIEGETLNPDEVRSSIARRLGLEVAGLPKAGRDVEGVVEMMLDATQKHAEPLTADRLFGWHAALFPTGRSGLLRIRVGAWRDDSGGPMRVISGPEGRERVHYQAPAAGRLDVEMSAFLAWFNGATPIDPAGTAPGLVVPPPDGRGGPTVVVMPGPPREIHEMWPVAVETPAFQAAVAGRTVYEERMLRLFAAECKIKMAWPGFEARQILFFYP